MLILSSCRHGLPEGELKSMHNLQAGWMQSLEAAEGKYQHVADIHNSFQLTATDTSNHWRHQLIRQDSLLQSRMHKLDDHFARASRRHLYQLKDLRNFLENNEIWLFRITTEGATRRSVRGSWDARTTQFQSKFDHVLKDQAELEAIVPEYEKLTLRLPGGQVAPAGLPYQPQPINPQPVAPVPSHL